MAGPVGRIGTVWALGLSLGTALGFLGLAREVSDAPWTAIAGGTVWVFMLALIVAMPLVAGRITRPSGWAPRVPGKHWAPMALTAGTGLCTLPFLFLLLLPWFGWRGTLLVAGAWMAVLAVACWVVCVTRETSSIESGPMEGTS